MIDQFANCARGSWLYALPSKKSAAETLPKVHVNRESFCFRYSRATYGVGVGFPTRGISPFGNPAMPATPLKPVPPASSPLNPNSVFLYLKVVNSVTVRLVSVSRIG